MLAKFEWSVEFWEKYCDDKVKKMKNGDDVYKILHPGAVDPVLLVYCK